MNQPLCSYFHCGLSETRSGKINQVYVNSLGMLTGMHGVAYLKQLRSLTSAKKVSETVLRKKSLEDTFYSSNE